MSKIETAKMFEDEDAFPYILMMIPGIVYGGFTLIFIFLILMNNILK